MIKYRLGDIVNVISEREDNPSNCKYDKFVGLEHYISGEVEIKKYGNTDLLKSAMKVFNAGDILIARRNVYLKRASIVNFDGITSGDSIVLRVKDELIKKLLPFVLNTDNFWEYAEKFSDGTMSKRLSPKILLEYEFNLPDIKEQEKLAELLWVTNDTKEAYKKLLSLTDELVKAQFIEMFGEPTENEKNWTVKKLKNLGTLNRGVSKHRPRNAPELIGGPYPLIQTGEVSSTDLYIKNYSNTYSEIGLKQSRMWKAGTLCITIAANIAQTAILTFDACFPDSIVGFIAGEDVNEIFMHYWFGFFQQILEEQAPQVAQKNINLKTLGDMDVIVPPISLQNQFVDFVKQAEKSKSELQQTISDIESTINTLMKQSMQ